MPNKVSITLGREKNYGSLLCPEHYGFYVVFIRGAQQQRIGRPDDRYFKNGYFAK